MSHVPYGYRIENGKAVIDEEKAKQDKFQLMLDAVNERLESVKAKF